MTKGEVAKAVGGEEIEVPIMDSLGNNIGTKRCAEIQSTIPSKFRIRKVIFDKENSRLFWRILGIAPVKNIIFFTRSLYRRI